MTPEERQMLGGLFQRVNAAGATPRDAEAEAFINDAVRPRPTRPMCSRRPCLSSSRPWRPPRPHRTTRGGGAAGAEQSQEHGSFLGNLGKSIFGGGAPPPRPGRTPTIRRKRSPARGYAPPPPRATRRQRPGPGAGAPQPQALSAARLSAAGRPSAPASGRRLPAERRFDRDRRRRRRRARQSARRPVRRPWRRRPVRRRLERRLPRRRPSRRQRDGQHLLRPRPTAATQQFDPSMPDDAGYLDDSSFDDFRAAAPTTPDPA